MDLYRLKALASLLIAEIHSYYKIRETLAYHVAGIRRLVERAPEARRGPVSMKCPLAASTPLVAIGLASPVHP